MKPHTVRYRTRQVLNEAGILKLLRKILTKRNTVALAAAFLLGRAVIAGGLMPFGFPLFAAALSLRVSRIAVAAAVLAGIASRGYGIQIMTVLFAMGIYIVLEAFSGRKHISPAKSGMLAALSLFIPSLLVNISSGFLLFDLITAIFHCFIVFTLVIIYRKAAVILDKERPETGFTSEQVISMALTASLATAGLSELNVAGFSPGSIVCILIIMLFAFGYGPGAGAAIGLTAGLVLSISSTQNHMLISSYAFCGFLAGILGRLGRMGSCIGFLLGNAFLTMYFTGSTHILIDIGDIAAGAAIFMLVPARTCRSVRIMMSGAVKMKDSSTYNSRIRDMAVERLKRFSKAFIDVSETFRQVSNCREDTGKKDVSAILERVSDRVCRDCGLKNHCWDRSFYSTYQVIFKIIGRLEKKGRIDVEGIPDYFLQRCERKERFLLEINNAYEMFRAGQIWKDRIEEAKNLVTHQLEGLSQVMCGLANDIGSKVLSSRDLEERLVDELNKKGVRVEEAAVFEERPGCCEIVVKHPGCSGNMLCKTVIEKTAQDVTGRKMKREGECTGQNSGKCVLRLLQQKTYSVTTGCVRITKHGSSAAGDSYSFMDIPGGRYFTALSDGMGSGKQAHRQSLAVVTFIEQFMEAGFDKDTAVRMINSLLLLKPGEEIFCTIDLVVIDLYAGRAEFIKTGAATSFIKSGSDVSTVRSVSLPAGILSGVRTEIEGRKLASGDFIILLSDGVLTPFGENPDSVMVRFLENTDTLNPQYLADAIIDEACLRCGGKPDDDMTVIVSKLWRRQ